MSAVAYCMFGHPFPCLNNSPVRKSGGTVVLFSVVGYYSTCRCTHSHTRIQLHADHWSVCINKQPQTTRVVCSIFILQKPKQEATSVNTNWSKTDFLFLSHTSGPVCSIFMVLLILFLSDVHRIFFVFCALSFLSLLYFLQYILAYCL